MSSPAPGSLSLFPSPNSSRPPPVNRNATPSGRRSGSRERRAPTPQSVRAQTPQQCSQEPGQSPPRQHRRQETPLQFDVALNHRAEPELPAQQAQHQQRSSISKPPLNDGGDSTEAQPLRSIFPTYNPNVPLGQQEYAPTAQSPTQIPRAVISRQSWRDPHPDEDGSVHNLAHSPRGGEPAPHRWAQPRSSEPPVVPKTSSTEQLRSFWKVANGWQASSSEGRVYCMKLTQEKDAPVYTLSSSSQPFYNIRLDPTSASARVTVMRHDPNKPYKDPAAEAASSSAPSILGALAATGGSDPSSLSSSKMTDGKHWQEALNTTLEEEARRHRPEDGLVAVLMPTPATRMALEKANDPQATMMAERECGRLVWDDDSDSYFLVHPALATPFCVTIERSPAWSRVEYTLEHHESPKHLAKLTRDGTGGGWIEVDTGLASKIEAFYVVDVAITALMLVANADEKNQPAPIEPFEPPPSLSLATLIGAPPPAQRKEKKSLFGSKKPQMEAFEIDLESQGDSVRKESKNKVKVKEGIDRLPFVIRAPLKIMKGLFKAFIWVLTILFKCVKFMFSPCYRLVGSKY